jgi:plastocyanin
MRVTKSVITVCALAVLAGCGGGGDGGGTNPPPPGPVASVSLSKTSATIKPSETTVITATPKDANGTSLSGRTVSWSVVSSSVATIAPNGSSVTVTGVANGTTDVSATVEGISNQAHITVTNAFPASADITVGPNGQTSFSPSDVDIAAGGSVTYTWGSAVTHNVTFVSPPAAVSNISDRSSGSASVTFSTPGTYNFQCTIHAGMNGSVTVH